MTLQPTGEALHEEAQHSGAVLPPPSALPELHLLSGPSDELSQAAGGLATAAALAGVEKGVDREKEVYRLSRDPNTFEVTVESDVSLEDYQSVTQPQDWERLTELADNYQGKTVVFFNPTMEGGGVAMMRPPLIHLLRKLGVDAHWYVLEPSKESEEKGNPFEFTKQMHNVMQRVSQTRITEEGKQRHWDWADGENGPILEEQPTIQNADVLFFDDPQPTPLIARLRAANHNPNLKVAWRNHIDTDGNLMADPNTPQGEIAKYLLDENGVRDVDAVFAHPQESFVHPEMADKTWFAPASFDHFDNLNRHLSPEDVNDGIEFINAEIARKNEELAAEGRIEDIQPLLDTDPNARRITLIARFDPSKGMDKAIEMGVRTRQEMRNMGVPEEELPDIDIIGNGSLDDTDGTWMYEEILKVRRQFPEEMDHITVMRLKHNYDAMNALMNRSTIGIQTSIVEGLETRVSDWIKHGKPVVVSNRGGIKTQVFEGRSGIILDYDKPGNDLERGAKYMAHLLTDSDAYRSLVEKTKQQATEYNLREFTTPANATRILRALTTLDRDPGAKADKVWKLSELDTIYSAEESEAIAA